MLALPFGFSGEHELYEAFEGFAFDALDAAAVESADVAAADGPVGAGFAAAFG